MSERLRCVVPFCRRTTKRTQFSEWICSDHWRRLPKIKRQVYGRLTRRWRRYHHEDDGIRADRIWARLKRAAIEAAGGIG